MFGRAVEALTNWRAQTSAGAEVFSDGARVTDASTVVLLFRACGL